MDIYEMLRVADCTDRNELQKKYAGMLASYRLVADFAEEPEVAEIAWEKIDRLREAAAEAGLTEDVGPRIHRSAQQELTSIRLALNSSRSDASLLLGNDIMGRIDALPDSAEKHYLKTVVLLKTDTSFDGCMDAVKEIQEAVRLDPGNMAYRGLMEALGEQFDAYEHHQLETAEKAERERTERERQSARALREAELRRFRQAAGPWLGGLGGLAASILGCVFCCKLCSGDCI